MYHPGSAEWALAQFENPLYVTERNDLLDFREGWHDGIVIDKLTPCERPPPSRALAMQLTTIFWRPFGSMRASIPG